MHLCRKAAALYENLNSPRVLLWYLTRIVPRKMQSMAFTHLHPSPEEMEDLELESLAHKVKSSQEQLRLFVEDKAERAALVDEGANADAETDELMGIAVVLLTTANKVRLSSVVNKRRLQEQGCQLAVIATSLALMRAGDSEDISYCIAKKRRVRTGKAFYLRTTPEESYHDFMSLSDLQF